MTVPSSTPDAFAAPPFGLRVAAILCAVVGVVSFVGALAVSVPGIASGALGWVALVVNLGAALAVCAAAVLAWRRRRAALWLVGAAWAVPTVFSLALGHGARSPALLLVLAFIALLGNGHELR